MTEKFLHYIWKMKLLNNSNLVTTTGEKVEIISAGEFNTNAGPDFSSAKIKIGKTLWAGNVELHLKSSDWRRHAHSNDNAYNNVILHCVYEADEEIKNASGKMIPCLELKGLFDNTIYNRYESLMKSEDWIPCEKQLSRVDKLTITSWTERLMIERLESKTKLIQNVLLQNQNNWEETFYQFLARSFGTKVNAEPFELLAKSLPVHVLAKHKNNLFQLEALLFGMSGLLEERFKEEYPLQLKKEFSFLRKKHALNPLDKSLWKFLRLRPANFPTVRLAQFASLISKSNHLFSRILDTGTVKELEKLFSVTPSTFWLNHFTIGKESVSRSKSLGRDFIHLLIINTIVPFVFLYGKWKDEEKFITQSLRLLEEIPPERNSIITHWSSAGVKAQSAFASQSLLQLKNYYCKEKRCLECAIGNKLLRGEQKKV